MRFVRLTNHMPKLEPNIMEEKGSSLIMNGKPTYKLTNKRGLEWASIERNDQFYSEWETVQPSPSKYAAFYELGDNTVVIKPREIFKLQQVIQQKIAEHRDYECKKIVVDYLREKNNNRNISHVICQIDDSTDIANLHTILNTGDVSKVVEEYSELFSGVFWNCFNEKDEAGFQVPTLMIMDNRCMNLRNVINTISYQRRKCGVDKFTGENLVELNPKEFKRLIESDLTIESATELVKIKEVLDNPNFSKLIDERINDFGLSDIANRIADADKYYNEIYIVLKGDENNIKEEIASNRVLQEQLKQRHKLGTKEPDIYMATYVEMLEEINNKKYFIQKEKQFDENDNRDGQNGQDDYER